MAFLTKPNQLSWNTAYNYLLRQKCHKKKWNCILNNVHWYIGWLIGLKFLKNPAIVTMNGLCASNNVNDLKKPWDFHFFSSFAWILSLLQQHDTINFWYKMPPQNSPLNSVTPLTFCVNLLSNCNNFHAICLSFFLANSS